MGKPATLRLSSGLFRFSGFQLLVSLGVLLVALPFLDQTPRGALFEGFLMTLVLLAAVFAVGGRRKTFITALALVIPVVITKWLDHLWPGIVPIELVATMAMVFLAYIALQLLRFVLTTPRVDGEVLCSAAATYLVLGMVWAYGYALVAHAAPEAFAFTRIDPRKNDAVRGPVFQLLHAHHGRLRRHRPHIQNRANIGHGRSDDGNVFRHDSNCPPGRALFDQFRGLGHRTRGPLMSNAPHMTIGANVIHAREGALADCGSPPPVWSRVSSLHCRRPTHRGR